MKIKSVFIKNFRAIKEQSFNAKDLSIFIGNNGTGKTSVLEAIHFALSPYFLSGRIKHTDFHQGTDELILIEIEFDNHFITEIPDGYVTQKVECNKVHLDIKKRDKATPNKTFSDGFVTNHYVIPVQGKSNEKGWEIIRKTGNPFKFTERSLTLSSLQIENLPRSFYFNKNRDQQLKKGYNSSISSVFDDFNWRFLKGLRKEELSEGEIDFYSKNKSLQDDILEKVDDAIIKKSFETLNEKLISFGLDKTGISFLDGNAPFDSAFLSRQIGKLDLSVVSFGSGIEMIVSLLFLETLASLSKENLIILIDEPELHLHPFLQEKFVSYLKNLSTSKQIFISTHSPYFFKNCLSNEKIELLITKENCGCGVIENTGKQFGIFPWSPSWGEINYTAYDLPTIEFHNELYGYLQEKSNCNYIDEFDIFFVNKGIQKNKKWIKIKNGQPTLPEDVTLITYIRNSIHHSENKFNNEYTYDELKRSIGIMINLLKSIL